MMVSGHSSFEILQKYLAAGVSVVCAMCAANSLAVGVVLQFGMTLIGSLR